MRTDNTIFKVYYDFDLKGETLILPNNCILLFKGGRFINGKLSGSIQNEFIKPEDVGGYNELGLFNALAICKKVKFTKGKNYVVGDEFYSDGGGHFMITRDRVIEGNGALLSIIDRKNNGTFFDVRSKSKLSIKNIDIDYNVREGGYGQIFRLLAGSLFMENVNCVAKSPRFSGFIDVEHCIELSIIDCNCTIFSASSGGFLWHRNDGNESSIFISRTRVVQDTYDEVLAFYTTKGSNTSNQMCNL